VSASSNSGSETVNDSLQEQPYLNSLQLILEKKALVAAEAALKRKKEKAEALASGTYVHNYVTSLD
jgi:hypothetical protein